MIRTLALSTTAALGLAACDAPAPTQTQTQTFVVPSPSGLVVQQPRSENVGFTVAPPNAPTGPRIDTFARNFLNGLQARSISERREFCGYFFVDSAGRLQATPPIAGRFASCSMAAPRRGQGIVASYHTHGAYGPSFDNEVPSVIDLVSDFDFGIDGYVSTPGGRVWLVDFQTMSTRQICGVGCVLQDPQYRPETDQNIRNSYTLPQLQTRSASLR